MFKKYNSAWASSLGSMEAGMIIVEVSSLHWVFAANAMLTRQSTISLAAIDSVVTLSSRRAAS